MSLMLLVLLLLMRLVARVLLVGRMLLVLSMRQNRIMLDRLAHGSGKHHGRRVLLRLHLLARRRAALALDAERIGDVGVWRTRRAIGDISVYGVWRGKEMLRIGALGLLRRVSLGLIWRRGVRSGRLLVLLVRVAARLEAASASTKAGL